MTTPPIKISDEAIKAGVSAYSDTEPDLDPPESVVGAILEAVAPLIAAQVLREAADLVNQHIVTPLGLTCPSCGARPGAAAKPLVCDNPIHWPENGRERSPACPGCDARPDEPHDAGCHGGEWGQYVRGRSLAVRECIHP